MNFQDDLRTKAYQFNGKNVGVFLIHDFGGTPAHLKEIGVGFADAGYSVSIPVLAGHGSTVEELNTLSFNELYSALETQFKQFKEQLEYVILLGFASGGAFAQLLAAEYEVDGLILINTLSSPPQKITEDIQAALDNNEAYFPTGTLDIKNDRAEPTVYAQYPTKLSAELLTVAEGLLPNAAKIVAPVLILQSVDDHVYLAKNADRLLNSFYSREKHLIMLQDSYHYAPIDYDQPRIMNQSIFFVKGLDPRRDD